jgi:hypothetical protein
LEQASEPRFHFESTDSLDGSLDASLSDETRNLALEALTTIRDLSVDEAESLLLDAAFPAKRSAASAGSHGPLPRPLGEATDWFSPARDFPRRCPQSRWRLAPRAQLGFFRENPVPECPRRGCLDVAAVRQDDNQDAPHGAPACGAPSRDVLRSAGIQ